MARFERAVMAALVGAAALAFTRGPLQATPWLALSIASVFWQVHTPEALAVAVRRAVLVVVGIVVVLGWTLMTYPIL